MAVSQLLHYTYPICLNIDVSLDDFEIRPSRWVSLFGQEILISHAEHLRFTSVACVIRFHLVLSSICIPIDYSLFYILLLVLLSQ